MEMGLVLTLPVVGLQKIKWLENKELPRVPYVIYDADPSFVPLPNSLTHRRSLSDRGGEPIAYLQYIIDFYYQLPESIAFVHGLKCVLSLSGLHFCVCLWSLARQPRSPLLCLCVTLVGIPSMLCTHPVSKAIYQYHYCHAHLVFGLETYNCYNCYYDDCHHHCHHH